MKIKDTEGFTEFLKRVVRINGVKAPFYMQPSLASVLQSNSGKYGVRKLMDAVHYNYLTNEMANVWTKTLQEW